MAVIDRSKIVNQLTSKMELPRDRYVLHCTSEKFGPSQGGNPMITREWELVAPESIEINGVTTIISGTKFQQYLVTKNMQGSEKYTAAELTAKSQGNLVKDLEKLGYTDDVDDENPPLIAKGKYVDAICGSTGGTMRKKQTPEQKKNRQEGDEILDGNGKPIQNFQHVMFELYGLAEKPANAGGF